MTRIKYDAIDDIGEECLKEYLGDVVDGLQTYLGREGEDLRKWIEGDSGLVDPAVAYEWGRLVGIADVLATYPLEVLDLLEIKL